ncbi:MAG: hypothetical protein L0Z62_40290 [Gemmataceae bacterium]|nr:hypothetical protein [Gemmataceae bacterium]
MTEAEWLACSNPAPMLALLRGKLSDRKLRLFGAACCRRVEHLQDGHRCGNLIEVIERHADGLASKVELDEAITAADQLQAETARAGYEAGERRGDYAEAEPLYEQSWAADVIVSAGRGNLEEAAFCTRSALMPRYSELLRVGSTEKQQEALDLAYHKELKHLSLLLRDVVGNPFRTVVMTPARLPVGVVTVTRSIYDGRRFEDLPILADALEEASCTSAELLTHLRSGGPHVRGCWALDLILSQS